MRTKHPTCIPGLCRDTNESSYSIIAGPRVCVCVRTRAFEVFGVPWKSSPIRIFIHGIDWKRTEFCRIYAKHLSGSVNLPRIPCTAVRGRLNCWFCSSE